MKPHNAQRDYNCYAMPRTELKNTLEGRLWEASQLGSTAECDRFKMNRRCDRQVKD